MDILTGETLASLEALKARTGTSLDWNLIFTLPAWLESWWGHFRGDSSLNLLSMKTGETITGVAPLRLNGDTAAFIGDPDVCDFHDFILDPGAHEAFFTTLLNELANAGVRQLNLADVRPDSTVMTRLAPMAEASGWRASTEPSNVSVEMDLPAGFDAYLDKLNSKQHHEVKRKLRRLEELGKINYRSIETKTEIEANLPLFFRFFTQSRSDKANFLSSEMESFFHDLILAMAADNLARLGILELDGKPVSAALYFDYKGARYLYNSGYDPAYGEFSVGLLSKVYSIRDAIDRGLKRYDFLKGAEPYKYYLGGKEVQLYKCRLTREAG